MSGVHSVGCAFPGQHAAADMARSFKGNDRPENVPLAQPCVAGDAGDTRRALRSDLIGTQRQHEKDVLLGWAGARDRHRCLLELERRHAAAARDRARLARHATISRLSDR